MSPEPQSQTNFDYCAAQVREYDYHRYFAATLASADARRGLIALYAFNLEIASVRERVSEAILGQMRLQWWRDTIGEIYGGTVRNHAVVSEIARAIAAYDLPRQGFERMIDARMFDLEDEPPEDSAALMTYASATSGQLAAMSALVCGEPGFVAGAEAVGRSWALSGLLRALPYHAAQRRVYLPKNILRECGLSPDDVMERRIASQMREAVAAIATLIGHSEAGYVGIPRPARPAVAYGAHATLYLRNLEKAGYDVYADRLEPSRFRAQVAIIRSKMTGKV
jgi:NADH dehydrogenase [ubiquinone] 1 alpha subcomplex assembly factor 6